MNLKQRLPFLRWSTLRLALGMPSFLRTGQIGDGREAACARYVETNARRGDIDDVLAAIDEFAFEKAMLVNVGDEKGQLLDAAVRRAAPTLALELGTYCGYSALRIARAAPSARICSIEFSAANAAVAQRIWAHAGVADRITCVVGTLGDGGRTLDRLAAEHGFSPPPVLICCSSITTSAPTCRTCRACSIGVGCIPVRSWSPTTSDCPAPRSTAPTCENSKGPGGTPSSTRPTSNTSP